MSFVKILIHCVWCTKNRMSFLMDRSKRIALLKHIKENGDRKGYYVFVVGGEKDRVHLLLSLQKNQDIAKIVQLIKGESSHGFSQEGCSKLEWQDDYFAVSIGKSQQESVVKYILNQEQHHRKKTFQEEFEAFCRTYQF